MSPGGTYLPSPGSCARRAGDDNDTAGQLGRRAGVCDAVQ